MSSGPHAGDRPYRESKSPRLDNVGRMEAFMRAHPEILITSPRVNGTGEFIAATMSGEKIAGDASLGWLMDKMEERFGDDTL